MSYEDPNHISYEAYMTLINSGLPTSIGSLQFNEVTFFSMSGPNFYGNNNLASGVDSPSNFDHSHVLFMFDEPVEDYTNRNMGDVTVDIGGVGVYVSGSDAFLCPLDPDGNFLTAYAGLQAINLTPAYYLPAAIPSGELCAVMAYYNGGYVPDFAFGCAVDPVNHPGAYLKAAYTYSLSYFNLVGNDLFEAALHGKYWNKDDSAPDTEEDGGGGTFQMPDYQLSIPDLPTDGALASKLVTAYIPTTSELQSFAQFLWSSNFIDNIKKTWSSPMENLISLFTLPIDASLIPAHSANITIGNTDSGVASHKLNDTSEYVRLDFGSIDLAAAYETFADFDTSVTLYLPFCGFTDIDINECMGASGKIGKIFVEYHVDVLTGDFAAYVSAEGGKTGSVQHRIDFKTGNMACQIPLSASNYTSVYNSLLGTIGSVISHNPLGAVGNMMNASPTYQKVSNLGGVSGKMAFPFPFIIVKWAMYEEPSKPPLYANRIGYPSSIITNLSSSKATGYIKVMEGSFQGENIPCTSEELEMITTLMESGVRTSDED